MAASTQRINELVAEHEIRVINVETVYRTDWLGRPIAPCGMRAWWESERLTAAELTQPLFDAVNSEENGMITALSITIFVLLIICGCAARIIYVSEQSLKSARRFDRALISEIDRAGWAVQYRSAQRAVCDELYGQNSDAN